MTAEQILLQFVSSDDFYYDRVDDVRLSAMLEIVTKAIENVKQDQKFPALVQLEHVRSALERSLITTDEPA